MAIIAFYSSDRRDMFKRDVYACMCLPTGYIAKFRYDTRYVQDNISESPSFAVGKQGIILFTYNNRPEATEPIASVAIRSVKVVDSYEESGTVYFFLELQEFVDVTAEANQVDILRPTDKFVCEVVLRTIREVSWIDKVRQVQGHFLSAPFTKITIKKVLWGAKHEIRPKYDKIYRRCYYQITEETSYPVEMTLFDNTGECGAFSICSSTAELRFGADIVDIGAKHEHLVHSVISSPLDRRIDPAFLRFMAGTSRDDDRELVEKICRFEINFAVRKSFRRSIWFGILTLLSASGLALSIALARNYKWGEVTDRALLTMAISSGLLIFIASAFLYFMFRKK